ncbi:heme-binding protein [Flavobacteriaceae bacterium]|nr:heme-binding protein [Flavobacteriaceae bacterium]
MIKYFLLLFSITMFSQGYETQKYEVVKQIENIEIRFYPPSLMAKVSSGGGFMKLFQYISGKNAKNEKMAMTTPVHMTNENNKSTMEFVLPSKYSLDNIATPNDKNIKIYNSKPGYYAAITYGGYSNSEKVKKNHSTLLNKLKAEDFKTLNDKPIILSYNSPYKFFSRRNEVLVEVEF